MNCFGRHTLTGFCGIIVILALSLTAQAQDRCSTAMARGTYAVACRGNADLGMGDAGLLPAVAPLLSLDKPHCASGPETLWDWRHPRHRATRKNGF